MKIYLNKTLFSEKLEEVKKLIDKEIDFNSNFNGSTYEILLDDFCWIDGVDEIDGTFLLHKILDL